VLLSSLGCMHCYSVNCYTVTHSMARGLHMGDFVSGGLHDIPYPKPLLRGAARGSKGGSPLDGHDRPLRRQYIRMLSMVRAYIDRWPHALWHAHGTLGPLGALMAGSEKSGGQAAATQAVRHR